jgi:exosortase
LDKVELGIVLNVLNIHRAGEMGKQRLLWLFGTYSVVLGWLYAGTLAAMVQDWWQNPDYSHGFLIPPLALYFLWERRMSLVSQPVQPSFWGLLGVLGGMGLLLLGTVSAELFTMRFSLLLTLAALIFLHAGWAALRTVWFPLAYLLFMIPLPALVYNTVAFPLQRVAANVAADTLPLLHIPVYREGNIISLSFATLEVTEACSGIRSLLSLMALAVAFAQLTQRTIIQKLFIALSALPITVIANSARVTVTGVLANFVSIDIAEGFFHTFSGWLVFVVAFVLLSLEGWMCTRIGQ